MKVLRRLLHCAKGATMVEFALLAPVFFLALFGVIEGSRLVWTQQTMAEVAYATARCMSVSSQCADSSAQQGFAVDRAGAYGVAILAADVTPESGVNCNGFPNSSKVTLTSPFNSVLDGFVPAFPDTLSAESCFPVLS